MWYSLPLERKESVSRKNDFSSHLPLKIRVFSCWSQWYGWLKMSQFFNFSLNPLSLESPLFPMKVDISLRDLHFSWYTVFEKREQKTERETSEKVCLSTEIADEIVGKELDASARFRWQLGWLPWISDVFCWYKKSKILLFLGGKCGKFCVWKRNDSVLNYPGSGFLKNQNVLGIKRKKKCWREVSPKD